jgi:hypothetical protein
VRDKEGVLPRDWTVKPLGKQKGRQKAALFVLTGDGNLKINV